MFKFNIIESEQHILGNHLIDVMVKKMRFFQKKNERMERKNEAIFIIAEGKEGGLLGGACLLKKELHAIHGDIRELVATLSFPDGHVWECSSIYVETLPTYSLQDIPESKCFAQHFYRELYEKFVEFGKAKNTGFVIMRITAEIYAATKEFGLWPYVVELKPQNSVDGYFHGVLPLTGNQYESYLKMWKALDA